jgi:Tfp pilus assembly protein PilN
MTLAEMRQSLPPRTLATLAVGAAVALGFLAVFLLPEYRDADQLTVQTAGLRAALDERMQLEPVAKALSETQAKVREVGSVGGQVKLPLADVEHLTTIFDGLAKPYGLRVTAVSPDAASVTREGLLAVRLGFLGSAEAARQFMLALGGYGPLVKVESASTVFGRDGREFSLKCWLAVQ